MKQYLLLISLVLTTVFAQAQQGLPVLVTSTTLGKIYEINTDNCAGRLICTTGKDFNDIAFTPNGKLYGRTIDTLFRIDTVTGNTFAIGRAPQGNALVGLNDSTLFIDSLNYLLSIKTTDASRRVIGDVGHNAEGDYTWIGKYLYMAAYNAPGNIIRMKFDSTYDHVLDIDTVVDLANPYNEGVTIALASAEVDSNIILIAFIGNTNYYKIDSETGTYSLLCSGTTVSTSGAASTIFPPLPQPTSINEATQEYLRISIYPNPVKNHFYIEFDSNYGNYKIAITDMEGKTLLIRDYSGIKTEIDISDFVSGLYFIQVRDHNNSLIHISKISKE